MAPSRTGAAPSKGFRRLAWAAVALTVALVVVGGVVRISDSGLGCGPAGSGTEGWPLCGGRLVPLIDTAMMIEYVHRALAGVVVVLIGALALLAWRRYPQRRALVRTSAAAFALVVVQAVLGGLTVEKGLTEELVAAHLGIAMVQLGLLMLVARLSRPESVGQARTAPPAAAGSLKVLAATASVVMLATIVAGGYMAATELRGTPGQHRHAAHTVCGTDFPSCNGSFLPFGKSRNLDIHLTHRALVYVATFLVLTLLVMVMRQRRRGRLPPGEERRLTRATGATAGILVLQLLLGALNVWLGEHAWLVVAHLVVGVALWSALVWVSLLVLEAREPVLATTRRDAEAGALPA